MYLMHHGIKGQKWGVKNGPPYPLKTQYRTKDKLSPPNTKYLKGYSGPAYFISEQSGFNKLEPRVPNNFFTENGFEDKDTKRVSFAPTVSKCLAGLSQNVEGKTYYVYSPDDIKSYRVYKPNTKAVPDSKITDELWITEPVRLKQVGKIKVTGNKGEDGKSFSYGSHTAELYDDWIYKDVSRS